MSDLKGGLRDPSGAGSRRSHRVPLAAAAVVVVAVAVAVAAVLLGVGSRPGSKPGGAAPALPSEGVLAGAPAPAFALPSLVGNGPAVVFRAGAGRPTVVTFFASWCPQCRKDLGVLAGAERRLGDRIRFVGVDVADSRPAALAMVASVGLSYPVGVDANRSVSGGRFHLVGLPSAVFVDGRGRVVGTVLGPITRSEVDRRVQQAEKPA